MEQGKCWCDDENYVDILWDEDHRRVFSLDGPNAMLRIRISEKQGIIGIPIEFCPYCGRKLADGEPRCPQKEEKGNGKCAIRAPKSEEKNHKFADPREEVGNERRDY